jgi:NAD+ synthase (glutamine-hydrolysing)
MIQHSFLRVAAASPLLRVADCGYNAEQIINLLRRAEEEAVSLIVFPELSLTGYTCADLFQHLVLQRGALDALEYLTKATCSHFSGIAVVGLPLAVDDQVFNCAAVLHHGRVLGIVPKSFIPNYKEFYEGRWFAAAATAHSREIQLHGLSVPFGTDHLFNAADVEGLTLGVEICEDLWVPIPPSSSQALAGATVLVNLSASNEVIGKANYRRQLVVNQSGRCMAAYVYAACGVGESTTDVVFGGHCLIAENGTLLAESKRFQREGILLSADVDLERLRADRMRTNSFGDALLYLRHDRKFDRKALRLVYADRPRPTPSGLRRTVEAHPFVPQGQELLRERCEEIFQTQVAGLAKRLEHIGKPLVSIGISGGLDSTLALLVVCKTLDALAVPHKRILAFTMPGFGTSSRTRDNARALMTALGVQAREVDIRPHCLEEMRALNHEPFGIDLTGLTVETLTERFRHIPPDQCQDLVFENVQARMRTSILMNAGFVIGTGDVSESALGWCTYNGDHMSMYNPNTSIPKTLVKFLVDWAARNEFEGDVRRTLLDVVDTLISPELLPLSSEGKQQATESSIGPYELHDFFLYHFLRYGAPPEKILFLASHAQFDHTYRPEDLRRWLQVFVRRFFANQFKRSCLPDGPKVGSISLSPRGDWRMPSDAQSRLWLQWAGGVTTQQPGAPATA